MQLKNYSCRIVNKKIIQLSLGKNLQNYQEIIIFIVVGFSKAVKNSWILATNLPLKYTTFCILNFYKNFMQIEESFRDVKSYRYGLGLDIIVPNDLPVFIWDS